MNNAKKMMKNICEFIALKTINFFIMIFTVLGFPFFTIYWLTLCDECRFFLNPYPYKEYKFYCFRPIRIKLYDGSVHYYWLCTLILKNDYRGEIDLCVLDNAPMHSIIIDAITKFFRGA